jgi:flagellin
MADKITLSSAVRNNLITLQRTAASIETTQTRLSSGQRVNSAIDDASAFFTSRALNNRATDLNGIKQNIDLAISTINAAIDGIDAITSLVEQAKGIANTAKASGDTSERSNLAVQFNSLLTQIDDLSNDASFNGTNLIQATPDNLEIDFNEDGTSSLTVLGTDNTTGTGGLNIVTANGDFTNDTDIDAAITAVNAALTTLRSNASTLGSNATVLQTRLSFTENLVSTLQDGSGKLTLADLNEESANLLALQTRQQLGINSLALAAQSERSILALFG